MAFNPLALILTILGGLIVAGVLGWVRKPRLCVLIPRMFSYSQITDRGQLVEITIFNRGFKTEESIEVTLNPTLKYEMLGTSNQDATVVENKLLVSRLGASDEVAVIMVVENGIFKPDDITQCLSKETKGTIANKLELVPITSSQRVSLIVWIVLIPALFYGVNYGIDYYLSKITTIAASADVDNKKSVDADVDNKKFVDLQGWKVNKVYSNNNELFKSFADKEFLISTTSIARKRDVVDVQVKFENRTKRIIEIQSVSMTTTKSESKIPSYDRVIHSLMLFPDKVEERIVKVIIPENSVDIADKTVFVDALIEDDSGETLSMRKNFVVN